MDWYLRPFPRSPQIPLASNQNTFLHFRLWKQLQKISKPLHTYETHHTSIPTEDLHRRSKVSVQGPVSLRLMTLQFKDIVTHTQKMKTIKCPFCGVWVQNFVWNFKGHLSNFTQNFEPIHRKICIIRSVKNLTTYDILKLWHLKS